MADFMELSVCTDCLILAANGDMPADPDPTQPEPLALWLNSPVIPGDAELGFSWQPCEGCGSQLGGDRYQAFVDLTAPLVETVPMP